MILYNADMKIPISNSLYGKKNYFQGIANVNPKILNKLRYEILSNIFLSCFANSISSGILEL